MAFDFSKLKKKSDKDDDAVEKDSNGNDVVVKDITKLDKDSKNVEDDNLRKDVRQIVKDGKSLSDKQNVVADKKGDDDSKQGTAAKSTPKANDGVNDSSGNSTDDDENSDQVSGGQGDNPNGVNSVALDQDSGTGSDNIKFGGNNAAQSDDEQDDQDNDGQGDGGVDNGQDENQDPEDDATMEPNDAATENDQSHANFKILPPNLYHKLFSQSEKLVNITIPHDINDGQMAQALDGASGPEGWLILYNVGGNRNIPIRILGHILTTYENFGNDAGKFITDELLSKVPSEENFDSDSDGETVGMEPANNKVVVNATDKDLQEDVFVFESLTNSKLDTIFERVDDLYNFLEVYVKNTGKMDFRVLYEGQQLDPVEDIGISTLDDK